MNSFKFSIIIAVYNVENYLEETITSIINQSIGFEDNVQLILVDDGSTDNSSKIISRFHTQYPENIVALNKSNGGQASARNYGLKYALGEYVNFLDSDDYFSENTLKVVYDFFNNHSNIDLVAIPMILFERVNSPHRLNTKFKETRIIDLELEPNNPQLSASSAFFKANAIKEYTFNTEIVNLEDALLINKLLLEKKKYGVLNNAEYYYRQRLDSDSTVDLMKTRKEYFIPRLESFYIDLINFCLKREGSVPSFIQYLFVYDLQWMLNINKLDVFDNQEEINEFWTKLYEVLNYINIECIVDNEFVNPNIVSFFVYLKNHKDLKLVENNELKVLSGEYIVEDFKDIRLWLDIIELRGDTLFISGNIESSFNNDNIKILLVKKSGNSISEIESLNVEYNDFRRSTLCYLDIDWKNRFNFDVKTEVSLNDEFYFKIVYDSGSTHYSMFPHVSFRDNCGLSTSGAFFVKNDKIVLFRFNKFYMLPYSYLSMIRFEISNVKRILYDKQYAYRHAILIRFLYLFLYPFYKNKRIWIYHDRPEFADDNARHLFEYSCNKKDNIMKYYVLNESSKDFNGMQKISKNIIKFGSYKHQLYFLFAEKIISSYVNEDFMNPFYYKTPSLYNGLKTTKRYFLQHGVTKDNISEFIKKYDKNLSLIVTVSDLEHDSFLEKGYNYDENVIQTLGFPRFDNLHEGENKKQILFIPTWRIELNKKSRFLNSEYYERLNSFFNNKNLEKMLNKYNYKLVFKPHPEIIKFIDLLNIPDYIEISENISYQDLFMKSSLLITDYSSVFFDFGYLEKPIIYYQNDDYHYDEGYFNYETMGFGKIVKTEKELINLIKKYVENDCIIEEEYVKRIHKFFKYRDKNNSKRVYEWILEDND